MPLDQAKRVNVEWCAGKEIWLTQWQNVIVALMVPQMAFVANGVLALPAQWPSYTV
jgi:hypothetical protein